MVDAEKKDDDDYDPFGVSISTQRNSFNWPAFKEPLKVGRRVERDVKQ